MRCSKVLLAVISTLILTRLSAETVAWYHFNEGENGERPASGQPVILNAVNPEILKGTPYVDKTSKAENLMVHEVNNNSIYMPVYTNVFPEGVSWYDPITKKRGTDRTGFYFNSKNGDGSGTGGIVLVEDDPVLHCENITVECMVKVIFHSEKTALKNQTHLITMRNSDFAGEGGKETKNIKAWGLLVTPDGYLLLHLHTLNEDGTKNGDKSTDKKIDSVNIADGKWHHIAFTYDGKTARVYVDYVRVLNHPWEYPLCYNPNSNGRLSIGACDASYYGRWQGFIDEVRISNEALGTDKFLRPGGYVTEEMEEKIESFADEDTVVYMPFDSLPISEDDPIFGKTSSTFPGFAFNVITNDGAAILKTYFPTDGMLPVGSQETVSNLLHAGLYASNTAANKGCWKFNENGVEYGRSIHMTLDNNSIKNGRLLTSDDFTLEFFINVHEKSTKNMYFVRDARLDSKKTAQTAWTLSLSNTGTLKLSLVSLDGGDTANISKSGFTYGQWHHIAVVVKRSARTAALYLDGVCAGEPALDFDPIPPSAELPESLEICGGYGVNANGGQAVKREDQFHNLSIDELRITRRALSPHEFLMAGANSVSAIEPTRAWLRFEGDLKVEPRPNEIPEGAFDCESASQVPAYSDIVPGIRIADGTGAIIRDSNVSSMKFSGGNNRIVFGRNVLLEREMDSMTIEFFVKNSGEPVPWAYFARMLSNYNAKSTGGQRVWSVGYNGTMKNESVFGSIYVSIDNGPEQAQWQTKHINNEVTIADGRWHHIAVTYEPDGDNTASKVYVDYKQIGTAKYNGRMVLGDSLLYSSLAIGNDFSGWIDELRISKGVLTVNEMMRAVGPGTVVIFR